MPALIEVGRIVARTPAPSDAVERARTTLTLVYLSLFLLLLVFFTVLVANTAPQRQSLISARDSIERSLGLDALGFGWSRRYDPSEADWGRALIGLRRLGALFRAELALVSVTASADGRRLEVALPADQLFLPATDRVRVERRDLLVGIAGILRRHPPGVRYEAEVLVGLAGRPTGGDPIARASALAHRLLNAAAPGERLSVGLDKGEPGLVRFVFVAVPAGSMRPTDAPARPRGGGGSPAGGRDGGTD